MNVTDKLRDNAQEATARSNIYGFFSLVYQKEPTEELLLRLDQHEIQALFQEWGADLSWLQSNRSQLIRELAIEYARLFLVPGEQRVPLFESFYSDSALGPGNLWGSQTVDVKRFFEAMSLRLEQPDLLPDHVAVEFEILQKLALKEAEAWTQSNESKAKEYQQAQQLFLEKHLGRWFPRFAEGVEHSAKHPFYKQVTQIAKMFLKTQ